MTDATLTIVTLLAPIPAVLLAYLIGSAAGLYGRSRAFGL